MTENEPKELRIYVQESGKRPFEDWLFGLKDKSIISRIVARLNRVAYGNLGDVKNLGEGLCELRLAFGSGYRIYFSFEGNKIVILISGGDKSSQTKDIRQARVFLDDYRRRSHGEGK